MTEVNDDVHDAKVFSFLEDKLRTADDLTSLDALVRSVEERQGKLNTQLQDAERELEEARQASREHVTSCHRRVQQFNKQQADIDRRLLIFTRSDTSDDAIRQFEATMDKLRNFDVATGYFELLRAVDKLREDALGRLESSGGLAIEPYRQLREMATTLLPLQEAAEGAAPHLLHHIISTANELRAKIKDTFAAGLSAFLSGIKWPTPDGVITQDRWPDWSSCMLKLLELQKPELEASELDSSSSSSSSNKAIVLLPLEIMVRPIEVRFRYHFDGDRPTNRIDKPEYFFSHVNDLITKHDDFLAANVQPLLSKVFRGSVLVSNLAYIDATSAFITALLPMLRNKIFSIFSKVSSKPPLFSHLMHEIMKFDTSLREEWDYDGGCGAKGWKGLAWEALAEKDWFSRWLQIEKDFALARYQEIIDTPDSGTLDFDTVDPSSTKPTKVAIRVIDLIEAITERYRPLASFSQKLRFLIDIQLSIFDRFHERLHSGLEAYLTLTSSLAALTTQNISKDEQAQLHGIGGLDRLCRVYGSAEYLERAMRDWGDDIFFLDLWTELQSRAHAASKEPAASAVVAGPLLLQDVAARTSSSLGTSANDDPLKRNVSGVNGSIEYGSVEGALFDETAAAYARLRTKTENVMTDLLGQAVRDALKAYVRGATFVVIPTNSTDSQSNSQSHLSSPSTLLAQPLTTTLPPLISFLRQALAPLPRRRILHATASAASRVLFDSVLMRQRFTVAGAMQFAIDVNAVKGVIDAGLAANVGSSDGRAGMSTAGVRGMERVFAALRLLTLPTDNGGEETEKEEEQQQHQHQHQQQRQPPPPQRQENISGMDSVDGDHPLNQSEGTMPDWKDSSVVTLWQAERMLFASNEHAHEFLSFLGVDVVEAVSEAEARNIIARRVELEG